MKNQELFGEFAGPYNEVNHLYLMTGPNLVIPDQGAKKRKTSKGRDAKAKTVQPRVVQNTGIKMASFGLCNHSKLSYQRIIANRDDPDGIQKAKDKVCNAILNG